MRILLIGAVLALTAALARAEPVRMEAVLAPTEVIKMSFRDGSKHFVAMVRREGMASGEGAFDGARVVEHGWHDIDPPRGGDPHGYLELTTPEGAIAYLKWSVRAVFMQGEGKPALFDNGIWELVSGTGRFAGMRGLGTLVIKPASETERRFILEGELRPAP